MLGKFGLMRRRRRGKRRYIPFKIYAKDLDGRKTLANKYEIEESGFSKEEDLLGKNDFDLYPQKIAEESTEEDF